MESVNTTNDYKTGEMSSNNFSNNVKKILNSAIRVYEQLGPGHNERIYHKALVYELNCLGYNLDTEILSICCTTLFNEQLDKIKINMDIFERIKLTKTDMMVNQRGVPYPILVPGFPILTTDDRLDYGSKIE